LVQHHQINLSNTGLRFTDSCCQMFCLFEYLELWRYVTFSEY